MVPSRLSAGVSLGDGGCDGRIAIVKFVLSFMVPMFNRGTMASGSRHLSRCRKGFDAVDRLLHPSKPS